MVLFFTCSLIIVSFFGVPVSAVNTVYYVSYSTGSDSNNGTSSTTPWKTLAKVSSLSFGSGDQILLKCGDEWNETLTLNGGGTMSNPVYVGKYGTGNSPMISPESNDVHCIRILNQAGFKIENLDLCNAMTGIYMEYINSYGFDYVEINNCYFHAINDTYNTNPNRYNHFSAGINFASFHGTGGDYTALTNLKVSNCTFNNCNVGFWSGSPWSRVNQSTGFLDSGYCMYMGDSVFLNMAATNCKQWGYSFQWFKTATMNNCDTYNVGWGTNQYGCAGILVGWSRAVTLDYCDVFWTYRGNQDFDGIGFDFEGGGNSTQNIYYRNSRVEYTDGCGVYFFHNGGVGGTASALVEACSISYFGQNPGNTYGSSEGIKFWDGTSQTWSTGNIRYNTFNRDNSREFYNGYPGAVNGFYFSNNTYNTVDSPCLWDFGYMNGRENWAWQSNSLGIGMSQDTLDLTITGSDPYMMGPAIRLTASKKKFIRIKMKNNSSSTTAELYWLTSTDQNWNENKKQQFTIIANDNNNTEYLIDLSANNFWSGTITKIRLDPSLSTSGSCNVDYINIQEKIWNFNATSESWYANNDNQSFAWQTGGYVGGTYAGSGDPQIFSSNNLGLDISNAKTIEIRMKNSTSTTSADIYFVTSADTTWNQAKNKSFSITANDPNYTTYSIDMSTVSGWTGTLKQLRVDPSSSATSGSFSIDYVCIYK